MMRCEKGCKAALVPFARYAHGDLAAAISYASVHYRAERAIELICFCSKSDAELVCSRPQVRKLWLVNGSLAMNRCEVRGD